MRIRHILLLVLLFYIFVAGLETFNFNLDHGGSGSYVSYNHLIEAFLSGKLHLLREPDPRLFELVDPYEPSANYPFKWHDASLYKGKYYLYFGPTPAILLFLPFKVITKATMTDTLASIIFMFGAVVWATLILLQIKRLYFQAIPRWMLITSIFLMGLASGAPYIVIKNGGLYHVAISCGCFFLIGGVYWLCRGTLSSPFSIKHLVLGSTFLGLAVGARPHYVLAGVVLLVAIWFRVTSSSNEINLRSRIHEAVALLAPFSICLLILGLYNYLRFENFTEFGFTYQIGDFNNTYGYHFNFNNIRTKLYPMLFRLPKFNAIFPFFHNDIDLYNAGLLYSISFLGLPFFSWILTRLNQKDCLNSNVLFPKFETLMVGIPSCVNLTIILFYSPHFPRRFVIEIALPLILISSIFWFYFSLRFIPRLKWWLNLFATLSGAISIVIGICFSIDYIRNYRIESIKGFESFFKGASDAVFKAHPDWDSVKYRVSNLPVKLKLNISALENDNSSNALDGNLLTDWRAKPDVRQIITLQGEYPATAKSIWLLSRQTTLYESWKNLEAEFYLNELLVSKQSFYFPDAHKNRILLAKLLPVKTDEIKLTFFNPVRVTRKGKYIEDINSLAPGYTEILIEKVD